VGSDRCSTLGLGEMEWSGPPFLLAPMSSRAVRGQCLAEPPGDAAHLILDVVVGMVARDDHDLVRAARAFGAPFGGIHVVRFQAAPRGTSEVLGDPYCLTADLTERGKRRPRRRYAEYHSA
jgi:hypothetical protein